MFDLPVVIETLVVFEINFGKKKALTGFEPVISCLLDRRFNQLSHRATTLLCGVKV